MPHVVGLELLNEPERGNMKLQGFYEKTIGELLPSVGPHFPIYVHDAWDTQHYAPWIAPQKGFIVLDHHLYRCFGGPDSDKDGDGQVRDLQENFGPYFKGLYDQAKGNLVVGEWSGGLRWDIIGHLPDEERDRHQRVWVHAQLELFKGSTAGWWFWNLKKEQGWDSSWSAKDEVRAEIMPANVGIGRFKGTPSQDVKNQAQSEAHGSSSCHFKSATC